MLAFEWVKLRSLRSDYVTLLAASAATLGITVVVAHAVASAPAHGGGAPFPPLTASFLAYASSWARAYC